MEMGPALVAMLLIALFIVGLALWYGTGFAKDFGNRIQGFQSCAGGVIGTLGGDTAVCAASSNCAGLSSDKTWQPLGEGWGCKGAEKYCCLSVAGIGASTQQIKEASCQEFKAGDIALIADNRCIKDGSNPQLDEPLGVRIYMPQYKSPCRAEVQLKGLTVLTKSYNDCGGSTAAGYDEIFNGKTGFDLLREFNTRLEMGGEGDMCIDFTTLNSGADLYVKFMGAGGSGQVIEKAFILDAPDSKACKNPSNRCAGNIEGQRASNAGNTYTDQLYVLNSDGTCSLGAEMAPNSNQALTKYCNEDLQYVGPRANRKPDACKWMKTPTCYVDYGNALMGKDYFLCEQAGTLHTCTQRYVEEEEALQYPECVNTGLG